MKRAKKHQLMTIERLERALLIVARCIELDGPVHMPAYERLEQKLEAMKRSSGAMDRARERLEANRHRLVETGLRAKAE